MTNCVKAEEKVVGIMLGDLPPLTSLPASLPGVDTIDVGKEE